MFVFSALLSPLLAGATAAETPDPGLARLLENHRRYLIEITPPPAPDAVRRWLENLDDSGKWTDLDYSDRKPSGWQPGHHPNRVSRLWLAYYQPGSAFTGNPAVRDVALRALGWWLLNKPEEPQWWYKEIGVPLAILETLLLARTELSPEFYQKALAQLGQHRVAREGANLIWSANLGMHHAAFKGDVPRVAELAKRLSDEVNRPNPEGIQSDYSYHAHGRRLQTFHYGNAYFLHCVRIAWQLRDTPWAWPGDKIDLLGDYVIEGIRWQLRGSFTTPSTLDRSVTRQGALRAAGAHPAHLRLLAECGAQRASELLAAADAIAAGKPAATGFRWYPRSDFAAWHSADTSFFLKTLSTRTLVSESINNENLRGGRLNHGDHYILRNGDEYFNLMGVWDWDRLPGVTWAENAGDAVRQPFSGGVSDGKSGVVSWHQHHETKDQTKGFSVRKTTFIKDGVALVLWSGLSVKGDIGPLRTALDQSRLQEATLVIRGSADAPSSVFHHGTGYVPIATGKSAAELLALHAGPLTGNWNVINRGMPDAPVTESAFLPSIVHEHQRGEGGYALLFNTTPSLTALAESAPPWEILIHTPEIQAVRWPDGTVHAAFHEAGEIPGVVATDRACLLIIGENGQQTWISDPVQRGGSVSLRLFDRPAVNLTLPADGSTHSL